MIWAQSIFSTKFNAIWYRFEVIWTGKLCAQRGLELGGRNIPQSKPYTRLPNTSQYKVRFFLPTFDSNSNGSLRPPKCGSPYWELWWAKWYQSWSYIPFSTSTRLSCTVLAKSTLVSDRQTNFVYFLTAKHNVSLQTTTPYAPSVVTEFDLVHFGRCPCDLVFNVCDVNCCCDQVVWSEIIHSLTSSLRNQFDFIWTRLTVIVSGSVGRADGNENELAKLVNKKPRNWLG